MKERRHFTRIVYSTPVQLKHQDTVLNASLIDLSLKGALISKPTNWQQNRQEYVVLAFTLGDSDAVLKMETKVMHEEAEYLGLRCEQIDIDSATHLKRMIELNVGDSDLLNRELEHLTHPEE